MEESVLCGGVLLRLIDTAGIRDTEDVVEQQGVERSQKAMESADLIFLVDDSMAEEDRDIGEDLDLTEAVCRTGKPWIYIASKRDLSGVIRTSVSSLDGHISPAASVSLSALTGEGLEELERAVAALFPAGDPQEAGSLLTDQRQEEAAFRARNAVRRAMEALENGLTPDAVLTDAEEALDALGELTGRTAKEEIVSRIFSRFCVGK